MGGRTCGSAQEICSLEEEVEFLLEWLPSVMRVEILAAHQLNSTSTGEDFLPRCLNVRSQFDGAELAEVRQRETDADLGTQLKWSRLKES